MKNFKILLLALFIMPIAPSLSFAGGNDGVVPNMYTKKRAEGRSATLKRIARRVRQRISANRGRGIIHKASTKRHSHVKVSSKQIFLGKPSQPKHWTKQKTKKTILPKNVKTPKSISSGGFTQSVGSRSCRNPTTTKQCLLCNCQNETGNANNNAKRNVVRVVLSRMQSSLYPSTACGVIRQKSQFSWFNGYYGKSSINGSYKDHRKVLQRRHIIRCTAAINEALALGPSGACSYHTRKTGRFMRSYPKWSRRYRVAMRDSSHVFYKSCGRRGRANSSKRTNRRRRSTRRRR